MKRDFTLFSCFVFLLIGILSGCESQKSTVLTNTLTFDMRKINSLRLDYDADDIHVLDSKTIK